MKLSFSLLFASLAVSGLMFASQGAAQNLPSAKIATKSLYKTNKRATMVRILAPNLVPAAYQAALQNATRVQRYYEAMAATPTEGMLGKSAVHAINHHSVAAAHNAAIAGCNAKKDKAAKDCVIVADFLPKGYKGPGSFSLSANATEVFAKKYKRAKKPKAFAISPSTGNWGQAVKAVSTEAAGATALADCKSNAAENGDKNSGADCMIVSVD